MATLGRMAPRDREGVFVNTRGLKMEFEVRSPDGALAKSGAGLTAFPDCAIGRRAAPAAGSIRATGSRLPHALRKAKCAPQKAMAAPRPRAARPASTPEMVGTGLGAEAAWPAPASTRTP